MVLSKEKFVELMNFIQQQQNLERELSDVLSRMSPNCYCDTYLYSEYESRLVELIQIILDDKYDNIGYRLYEYSNFTPDYQIIQCKETPELASWETLYDFLIKNKTQE